MRRHPPANPGRFSLQGTAPIGPPGSEGDDPRAKAVPTGLGHIGRGRQRHAGESAEQTVRHAFNGELRNLWQRGWSVEANVPSLAQAHQGTPQPTSVPPVISVNMYPNM